MALVFTTLFTKVLKNIFDLVALQAQRLELLLQSQSKLAELGEMLANIAHQWQQPLTRLSLVLQNLQAYKNKSKMSDILFHGSMKQAFTQIDFMSNTVENFKNFYKYDEHKQEFLLQDAIQSVLDIIGESLKQANIELTINSLQKTVLYANKNEFSQVLLNLILNARDVLLEREVKKPTITINIKENVYGIIIEICDNGGGIAEDIQDKIFDPYFSTKRDRGTGIGLYVTKKIIEEKMGAKLSVHNSNEGAVFRIELYM